MRVDKPKVGSRGNPTLVKKQAVSIDPRVDDQSITDPQARSYAARIQERAQVRKGAASIKGNSPPLGHVESPSREKMEAIANFGMASPRFDEGIPEDMRSPPDMPQSKPPPRTPQGVGAAFPVNQAMAQGKVNRPVSLREANKMASSSSNFSPETIQALKMAQESVESGQREPPQEETQEEQDARLKSVAAETRSELDDAEKEFEPDSPLNDMDMASLANIRSGLMSKERREAIESRLKPMDLADMIVKREIQQTIPILPGKFEVTLRTFNQRENLWVLKYLYDFSGSVYYTNELLNTCRLVCGLLAVNGQYLPDHREDPGGSKETVSKEAFEKKLFHVTSFPVQLVADMSVQSIWFQDRVDKLFTVGSLKNG